MCVCQDQATITLLVPHRAWRLTACHLKKTGLASVSRV
jgi:hypothetical protein